MKKKRKYGVTGTGQESERPAGLGRSYRACSNYYRGGGKGPKEPEGEERSCGACSVSQHTDYKVSVLSSLPGMGASGICGPRRGRGP